MNDITGLNGCKNNYSYQHIQGVMLVNLNKLAFELCLSHKTYRLLGLLISHWNITTQNAFPAIDYLARASCMSKTTIINSLDSLTNKGLLVIFKKKGGQNHYYFSQCFFQGLRKPFEKIKPETRTTCKTKHDNKQIKKKTNLINHIDVIKLIDVLKIKLVLKNQPLLLPPVIDKCSTITSYTLFKQLLPQYNLQLSG